MGKTIESLDRMEALLAFSAFAWRESSLKTEAVALFQKDSSYTQRRLREISQD